MTLIGILETFGTAAAFEELSHTWAWYGAFKTCLWWEAVAEQFIPHLTFTGCS